MEIEVKIKISNVHEWNIDWNDDSEKSRELILLNQDIEQTLSKYCGLDIRNIDVETKLIS